MKAPKRAIYRAINERMAELSEYEEADAGFDAGEWSRAHWGNVMESEVERIATKYGWTLDEVRDAEMADAATQYERTGR